MWNLYGTVFSKCLSPIFARRNPTETYVFLWTSQNSTVCLRLTIPTSIIKLAHCQTRHNTWQGNLSSACWIASRLIIVCRWQTNFQWKNLYLNLPGELFSTEDWHKASADLSLLSQVLCMSSSTLFSKLNNVLSTWTILGWQQTMPRTIPGTFRQSSTAFIRQDWIRQK